MWCDVGIVQHLPTRKYTNKEGGHNVSCLIVTALQSRGGKKEEGDVASGPRPEALLTIQITSRSKYELVFTGISTL